MIIVRRKALPLLLAVVCAAACAKEKAGGSSGGSEPSSDGPLPVDQVKKVLEAVPADAAVVATLAFRRPMLQPPVGDGLFDLDQEIAKEFRAELTEHMDRHLGVDLSGVQTAAVFLVGSPPTPALVVGPVDGSLRDAQKVDGAQVRAISPQDNLVAGLASGRLVAGHQDAVNAALATLSGKTPNLLSAGGELAESVTSQIDKANIVAVADISRLPIPPNPMTQGLKGATLTVGDTFRVEIRGQKETLEALAAQLQMGIQMGIGQLAQQKAAAQGNLEEGAVAILAHAYLRNFAKRLEPVIADDKMVVELPLPGGSEGATMLVSMVGIMSAVAIPAFMKYIKKSKASEARMLVQMIADRAMLYQAETGTLPPSTEPTPPLGTCCQLDPDDGTCPPNPTLWQNPTWQALGFSLDDEHRYSVQFRSEGDQFLVLAFGDLDCDGIYSTFATGGGAGAPEEREVMTEEELE